MAGGTTPDHPPRHVRAAHLHPGPGNRRRSAHRADGVCRAAAGAGTGFIILLARRRESQPRGARTAGCVFKNPAGGSAGQILDELGCKGLSRGGARVSEVHANFIGARQGATAADIRWLVEEMRRRAREERGIELETEIELWGFADAQAT